MAHCGSHCESECAPVPTSSRLKHYAVHWLLLLTLATLLAQRNSDGHLVTSFDAGSGWEEIWLQIGQDL